jgi:hypothetical protein
VSGWLEALERSALGTAMRDSNWLYPAAETVHLLGLATLVGCAVAFDLRLLGVCRHLPARATARHLLTCARLGFAVAAISGFLLFTSDATAVAADPAFAGSSPSSLPRALRPAVPPWPFPPGRKLGSGTTHTHRSENRCRSVAGGLDRVVVAGRLIAYV